jgi:hypothetical protein
VNRDSPDGLTRDFLGRGELRDQTSSPAACTVPAVAIDPKVKSLHAQASVARAGRRVSTSRSTFDGLPSGSPLGPEFSAARFGG